MFERRLFRLPTFYAPIAAAFAALVLLFCGAMLTIQEPPFASDCCSTVRPVHPQMPISLFAAVLPPTVLLAGLRGLSRAIAHALDHPRTDPGPRVLCLRC